LRLGGRLGSGMPRRALLLPALIAILATLPIYALLSKLAVVEIRSGDEVERITITCGSKLVVSFNNSVTGSPVSFLFDICGDGFQGVGVVADEITVEYYTAGLIDINGSIKAFKSQVLEYCSSQEVRVLVGGRELSFKGVCVVLRVRPYVDLQS